MEQLLHQGIVDHLLHLGADIHIDELVIAHVGMNAVRKEDIDQVIFRIGPGQCAGKAGMPKAKW